MTNYEKERESVIGELEPMVVTNIGVKQKKKMTPKNKLIIYFSMLVSCIIVGLFIFAYVKVQNWMEEIKRRKENPYVQQEMLSYLEEKYGEEFEMKSFKGIGEDYQTYAEMIAYPKKEGEKYTWIQMLPNDTDLPENKKRKFRVETSDYFVRVSFPYPNFTKKYNFYQGITAIDEKAEESKWIENEDGTTQIEEVSVQGKRLRGLREFKESYPAYLIDAYEARNRHFDSGMLFASIARLFVGDYGQETPYVYDVESGTRVYKLYSLWGIDRITKEQEGIQPPLDSAYHPKYLKVYFQKVLPQTIPYLQ